MENTTSKDVKDMTIYERVMAGMKACLEEKNCDNCPYNCCDDCPYNSANCDLLDSEALSIIKAQKMAWEEVREALEKLIEYNDGDVKRICTFLLNLMRIKEVDIEKGFYI